MKVHFTTLGCPKNQVDSELMLGMLAGAGHEIVPRAELPSAWWSIRALSSIAPARSRSIPSSTWPS